MAVFTCKMCGGNLVVDHAESVAECEYCGTKQTIPKLDNEKRENLYTRANHFRRNNEYDKAMAIYEQILSEDSQDAEAYWSIVLCRYGIEYVKDPATKKRIPTINRTQFTSIFLDEDYKSALSYADPAQVEIYKEEAQRIDEIQKGILDISRKEKPFDVFISYKETDEHGKRTRDSVLAGQIYHELVREGYKTFFAKITLEDKLGEEYEPYIFAALNSAKVMVVVGTKPEYFNAVWVKNEWSRYLKLIKEGAQKHLIPAYRDMDPYDLPEEFAYLQALDMAKLGFMQDLIRGIKKMIGGPSGSKPTAPPETSKSSQVADVAPLLERGRIALDDKEWDKAIGFYERVLDRNPKCARAYLGEALAERHFSSLKELTDDLVRTDKEIPLAPEVYGFPIDTLRERMNLEFAEADDEFKHYIQEASVYYGVASYLSEKKYWTDQKMSLQALIKDKKIVKAVKFDTEHEIKDFELFDQTLEKLDELIAKADEKGIEQRTELQKIYDSYISMLVAQVHSEKKIRDEVESLQQKIDASSKEVDSLDDERKASYDEMKSAEKQLAEIGRNPLKRKSIKAFQKAKSDAEGKYYQLGEKRAQIEEEISELAKQLFRKKEEYEEEHKKTIEFLGTPQDTDAEDSASQEDGSEKDGIEVPSNQVIKDVKRLKLFLKHKDWKNAEEYCNKVLEQDPSNDDALVGKLLCAVKVNKKSELASITEPLSDYPEYSDILRYGDEETVTELEGYNDQILARTAEAEEEQRKKEEYNRALEEKERAEEQLRKEVEERRRAEQKAKEEHDELVRAHEAELARAQLQVQSNDTPVQNTSFNAPANNTKKPAGCCLGSLFKWMFIIFVGLLILSYFSSHRSRADEVNSGMMLTEMSEGYVSDGFDKENLLSMRNGCLII